jgi:hypothetical protein
MERQMILDLNRKERHSICDAINRELQRMAADYAASCDRKAPNLVLFHEHGLLTRLRDKVLTGKSYAEQDRDAQDAAEVSERTGMALMGHWPDGGEYQSFAELNRGRRSVGE